MLKESKLHLFSLLAVFVSLIIFGVLDTTSTLITLSIGVITVASLAAAFYFHRLFINVITEQLTEVTKEKQHQQSAQNEGTQYLELVKAIVPTWEK